LGKIYTKFIPILGPVSPHFKNHNGEIWREGVDPGLPLMPNFIKIA